MAKILKINHIAIAVNDLNSPLAFWQDKLGLSLEHSENVPSEKTEVAFLPISESEIELIHPTDDSTGLAKYLDKKGPGIHHICFEVDNLIEMMAELKEKGVRLLSDEPRIAAGGNKMCFIHPKDAGGVLIELYEIK